MPLAPRARPAEAVVIRSFAGHVTARPKAVFDALDQRFRPATDAKTLYLADPAAFLIIVQGGWWYRGEYRVVPDARGSNVEHYLVNIARNQRLGRLSGRTEIERAPRQFERLLKELRLEVE